jgi:hypothetical protein
MLLCVVAELHEVCSGLCVRGNENTRARSNEEEINISCTYSDATFVDLCSARQKAKASLCGGEK